MEKCNTKYTRAYASLHKYTIAHARISLLLTQDRIRDSDGLGVEEVVRLDHDEPLLAPDGDAGGREGAVQVGLPVKVSVLLLQLVHRDRVVHGGGVPPVRVGGHYLQQCHGVTVHHAAISYPPRPMFRGVSLAWAYQ